MERALFIAGFALIAFLYGAFTVQYQVFPYSFLKEAKLGLAAWAACGSRKKAYTSSPARST